MKKLLKDYLKIFETYPKNQYLSKKERQERYRLFQAYGRQTYEQLPNIEEFSRFMEDYQEQIVIQPQLLDKLTPVLADDVARGGVWSLKFLLGESVEESYYLKFFSWAYPAFGERMDLLNLLLEREPDYRPALEQKFQLLFNAADFSIHELPSGILDGMDGASAENVPAMLADLEELLTLADQLGRRNAELESFVADCRGYYLAWQAYLQEADRTRLSFKDYMDDQGLSY